MASGAAGRSREAGEQLRALRALPGARRTVGLRHDVVARFLASDESLVAAVGMAHRRHVALRSEHGDTLLAACELDPARFRAQGPDGLETYMRRHGVGVIHGGQNALRFTPHFAVTRDELALLVDGLRDALARGPRG